MTETIELCHWINGEKIPADCPGESLNPSDTREVVARTPDGGEAEVNAAVASARAAFTGWSGRRRNCARISSTAPVRW